MDDASPRPAWVGRKLDQARTRSLRSNETLATQGSTIPMGPYSYIYIYIYLGLKVVPMSLLLGLFMYYIGTWTHWVFRTLEPLRAFKGLSFGCLPSDPEGPGASLGES